MESSLIELASRRTDGVDVRLLWHAERGKAILSLADERSGRRFALTVSQSKAMDAFRDPFAYAQNFAPLRAA